MKRTILMLISGMIGISILSSCGKTESKEEPNDSTTITPAINGEAAPAVESTQEDSEYPYLPVLQKMLDSIVDNDYDNFLSTLHPALQEKATQYNDIEHLFEGFQEEISENHLDTNIKEITQSNNNELINEGKNYSKNYNLSKIYYVTFNLMADDVDISSMTFYNCVCLIDDKWYTIPSKDLDENPTEENRQYQFAKENAIKLYNYVEEYINEHPKEKLKSFEANLGSDEGDSWDSLKFELWENCELEYKDSNGWSSSGTCYVDFDENGKLNFVQWKSPDSEKVIGEYPINRYSYEKYSDTVDWKWKQKNDDTTIEDIRGGN